MRQRQTDHETETRETERQIIDWKHYLSGSRCTKVRVGKVSRAGGARTVALTDDQWQEPEQTHSYDNNGSPNDINVPQSCELAGLRR